MNEQEFEQRADAIFGQIEQALDAASDSEEARDLDYETLPGGVLEIEGVGRGKIVVNRHVANREIWVAAAASGGFHFAWNGADWRDTRSERTLPAYLNELFAQAGVHIELSGLNTV
ncbi:protein CyaY [Betaproteobacteria bacterium]|nr:protein CyaY [Betaproteobacteria bacterium]GHU44158.1 protein CyaY [Betaproteobacteria bacterium]